MRWRNHPLSFRRGECGRGAWRDPRSQWLCRRAAPWQHRSSRLVPERMGRPWPCPPTQFRARLRSSTNTRGHPGAPGWSVASCPGFSLVRMARTRAPARSTGARLGSSQGWLCAADEEGASRVGPAMAGDHVSADSSSSTDLLVMVRAPARALQGTLMNQRRAGSRTRLVRSALGVPTVLWCC